VIGPGPMFPTEFGPVRCASLDREDIHHLGYKPSHGTGRLGSIREGADSAEDG
jgi:hypothetical protein